MDKDELAEKYLKKFNSPMVGDGTQDPMELKTKDMLYEYFRIGIEDDKLVSLPKIVKEIPPFIDYLPVFIVKLAATVDYTAESTCFRKICELLAEYFSHFIYYYALNHQEEEHDEGSDKLNNVEFILKNILFPRLKKGLKVRSKFGTEIDKTFTTITCLENLYKVFERCE